MNMFSRHPQRSRLQRWFEFGRPLAAALLCAGLLPAQANGVRVAESFGFSHAFGSTWSVDSTDSPIILERFDGSGTARFGMSFDGAAFHLTALNDNSLASTASLPWGLCLFPLLGSMIPPGDDGSTSLGFIPWFEFPSVAGHCVDVAVPVPEPGSFSLVVAGSFILAGLFGRRATRAPGHDVQAT